MSTTEHDQGSTGGVALDPADYRKREESITIAPVDQQLPARPDGRQEEQEQELLTLNFGPHHPATHGVLRLLVTLEGEVVRDMKPIIGYVHTGIEKTAEDKSYWKAIPVIERMDYLAYYFNAHAFCGAVETLLDLEVPPRAQYLRVIHLELNRIMSHLVWLGTGALDLGAISVFWYCFRERETILDLFEMSSGQRMHTRYIQVGGVMEDIPRGFEEKTREFCKLMVERADQYADLLERNEIVLQRLRNTGVTDARPCSTTASPGRSCAPQEIRGTCARRRPTRPTTTSTSRSRSGPWATTTTATACATPRSTSRSRSSSRPSTGSPAGLTSPRIARSRCLRATSWRPAWRH